MKIILPALSLHTTRVLVLIYVLLGMVFAAYADEHADGDRTQENVSALFQSHERLTMRLEAPFKKLVRKRGEDRPYSEAALIYKDGAGNDIRVDLKIRVRGKYRAKKEICRFPPSQAEFQQEKSRRHNLQWGGQTETGNALQVFIQI